MINEAFFNILRSRRSVRSFKAEALPKDLIYKLIEAACWAPSAGNRQNWQFTVITSESLKQEMAQAVSEEWQRLMNRPDMAVIAETLREYSKYFNWFSAAPVLLLLSAKSPESFLEQLLDTAAIDVAGTKISVAMAAQNLMLAAHAVGVASCCLTAPLVAEQALRKLLALHSRQVVVCLIALGYTDQEPSQPVRKAPDLVTRFIE